MFHFYFLTFFEGNTIFLHGNFEQLQTSVGETIWKDFLGQKQR